MKEINHDYQLLSQFPLGMAYVPDQQFIHLYEHLEEAYSKGTLFKDLEQPFTGRRCVR